MNLFKQHKVLTAVAAILVLLTLTIWIAQENEQVLLIEPQVTASATEQAYTKDILVYEAELLADYTLPDRHLDFQEEETWQAESTTTLAPPATTSTTAAEQDLTKQIHATSKDEDFSVIRPPRQTLERDEAGIPQENRPLDAFRADDSTIYIKAFHANIRSLPRTDADLVIELEMGDKLKRTGYGNYWSAVVTEDGKKGFVLTDLISEQLVYKLAPSPTPRPTAAPRQTTTKTTTTKQTTTTQASTTKQTEAAKTEPEAEAIPEPTKAPSSTATEPAEHSDEFMLFARVIAMEGNGQYESYLAVASVIMNHVSHRSFPNTITGVLSRPGAFSVYRTAASGQPARVNSNAMKAASDAYYHGKRNLPSYVIAFCTPAAYEKNVANNGSFSKMAVYQRAYNAVWCYYPADKR